MSHRIDRQDRLESLPEIAQCVTFFDKVAAELASLRVPVWPGRKRPVVTRHKCRG
jgi:hypothetical protein